MSLVMPPQRLSVFAILFALESAIVPGEFSSVAFAQSPSRSGGGAGQASRATSDSAKRVTLSKKVEPSFHIEPIVHRFEARRGAVIPFTFEIASTGKDMNVDVLPVRLRQEESGVILHDLSSPSPDEVKIDSPGTFTLRAGDKHHIEGTVTVPLARTNFLSYGILVRDKGFRGEDGAAAGEANSTMAEVNFVTQYVLRIDIETGVRDSSAMNLLKLERGELASELGMPLARVYLTNPTEFAFEFKVRGSIGAPDADRKSPFWLSMLSRRNLLDDERTLIRVMPNSRLRLESSVPSLNLNGDQILRVGITNGRREVVAQEFEVDQANDSFPALAATIAHLPNGVSVTPSQVRIGQVADVDRTATLQFSNGSELPHGVSLSIRDLEGNEVDGVRASSNEFEVKPGRTKTIRLTMKRTRNQNVPVDGVIQITSGRRKQFRELPIAMLFGEAKAPSVEVAELQMLSQAGRQFFSVRVTNSGDGYVPVDGRLKLASESGWHLEMADGYGVWLKPGEVRDLVFDPRRDMMAGQYKIEYEIRTGDAGQPVSKTLVFELEATGADQGEPDEVKPDTGSA